ncbi:hypothetical protein [Fluviicola sp.]|uniref:hypothetical protein n=1 Tax=Fluviicola sp. TaxID=1917219 RepID=UPI003D2B4E09
MKNFVLLITLTTLLASCNFNAQRKAEINKKLTQLDMRISKRMDQRLKIKKQRENLIVTFKTSLTDNLSKSVMDSMENQFQQQLKLLEIQENKCEINNLKDKLEIEKLKLEYLRY